jgi:hypothetical protein
MSPARRYIFLPARAKNEREKERIRGGGSEEDRRRIRGGFEEAKRVEIRREGCINPPVVDLASRASYVTRSLPSLPPTLVLSLSPSLSHPFPSSISPLSIARSRSLLPLRVTFDVVTSHDLIFI